MQITFESLEELYSFSIWLAINSDQKHVILQVQDLTYDVTPDIPAGWAAEKN